MKQVLHMSQKFGLLKIILPTVIITLVVSGVFGRLFDKPQSAGSQTTANQTIPDGHDHDGEGNKPLYTCGMHPWIVTEEPGDCPICGMELTLKRDTGPAATNPGERRIVYWRAPMNPMEISEQPGKSAMGMDLVPVYEDELISGVPVAIDPVTRQNMGLRIAQVEQGPGHHTIRTYGHLTYDETRSFRISPKFSGWIEKLDVDFTGQIVEAGQPLFEVYSPELLTAQEEYLLAYRRIRQGGNGRNSEMLASARRRLLYFDVAPSEIEAIEASGQVQKTLVIRSPFKGVVTARNAIQGGYFMPGATLYELADISHIWVEAHTYEYETAVIKPGQNAEMTLPYQPGQVYTGKVTYIYPYLQQKTRDVVIRLEFDNPDLALKPDMYADVRIKVPYDRTCIAVPSEAVIRSGERNVVFVAQEGGRFVPREVTLGGPVDDGRIQILTGLVQGENVVVSGQFMLDSESKLQEAVQKMMAATNPPPAPSQPENKDDFFEDMED